MSFTTEQSFAEILFSDRSEKITNSKSDVENEIVEKTTKSAIAFLQKTSDDTGDSM